MGCSQKKSTSLSERPSLDISNLKNCWTSETKCACSNGVFRLRGPNFGAKIILQLGPLLRSARLQPFRGWSRAERRRGPFNGIFAPKFRPRSRKTLFFPRWAWSEEGEKTFGGDPRFRGSGAKPSTKGENQRSSFQARYVDTGSQKNRLQFLSDHPST